MDIGGGGDKRRCTVHREQGVHGVAKGCWAFCTGELYDRYSCISKFLAVKLGSIAAEWTAVSE